jgi:hypothetical protein
MPADPDIDSDPVQPPWPLSQLDTSPAATRRRGLRLFHVVLLILGGTLWAATSLLVVAIAALACGIGLALLARGRIPELAASIDRLGGELTETYARIEETNHGIEEAKRDAAAERIRRSS